MTNTIGCWVWRNAKGEIIIKPANDGRYDLLLNRDWVGNYHSPEAAAGDAHHGSHFSVPSGLLTSDLGPPENLREWAFKPLRKR